MKLIHWQVTGLCLSAMALPTASSALDCNASFSNSDIAFGQVYLRDSVAEQSFADVEISCSGGAANGSARVCLRLGSGSGGAGAGSSPRYMRRDDNEPLAYELTAGSHGGPVWQTVEFPIALDGTGAGSILPGIYAEITSSGESFGGGFYSSTFSGVDLGLTYGGAECSQSGTVTGGLTVSATVTPSCAVTAGALDFGLIDASLASPSDAEAFINVTCTNATPYSVTLGPGNGAGVSDPQARKMVNGGHELTYGLYLDLSRVEPWGWMTGEVYGGTGTGVAQSLTVYGRIHAAQITRLGTYTDSVVVTVNY